MLDSERNALLGFVPTRVIGQLACFVNRGSASNRIQKVDLFGAESFGIVIDNPGLC